MPETHGFARASEAKAHADARSSFVAARTSAIYSFFGLTTTFIPSRKWRNWQTHQLEGLALARAWGFESPLPHHKKRAP